MYARSGSLLHACGADHEGQKQEDLVLMFPKIDAAHQPV